MVKIWKTRLRYSGVNGGVSDVRGVNIGGFVKVADAMLAYGIV
jgi:glutamate dehydrogenase (NADP+)